MNAAGSNPIDNPTKPGTQYSPIAQPLALIHLRLPPPLHDQVREHARQYHITEHTALVQLIEQGLAHESIDQE